MTCVGLGPLPGTGRGEKEQGPSKFFFYDSFSAAPQRPKETPHRRAGPLCGDTEGGDGPGHGPWRPSCPELEKRSGEHLGHAGRLGGRRRRRQLLAGTSLLPTQAQKFPEPQLPAGRMCTRLTRCVWA